MNGFRPRLTSLFCMLSDSQNAADKKHPMYTPSGTLGLNRDIELHAKKVESEFPDSKCDSPLDMFAESYYTPTGTDHNRIVVFFTNAVENEIYEIGAIEVVADELKNHFHTYAIPSQPLPAECGVSESYLQSREFPPTMMAVLNFLNWVRDAPLVSMGTQEHLCRLAYTINQLRWVAHLTEPEEEFAKDIGVIATGLYYTVQEVGAFKPPVSHPMYDIMYDARRRFKQKCLIGLADRLRLALPPLGGSAIETAVAIALSYEKMKGSHLVKERVSFVILN